MRNILFIELLGGIGDVLIALPAIQALARSHPEARLTVITLPPGADLLAHDPLIAHVVVAPLSRRAHPHAIRDFVAAFVSTVLAEHAFDLIALGRALQRRYAATIVVPTGAGGDEDARTAERVARGIGGSTRAYPAVALRDLAALLAHGDLFVAADTGAARIAAALGLPTITLFGPSWSGRYGEASPHANLQGYPECPERIISNFTVQRCWYSGVCPLGQWRTCLEAISVDKVLAAAEQLLAAHPVPDAEASFKAKRATGGR